MNLKEILNDALNKAMCQKGRIQEPNSNKIAEFVNEYLRYKGESVDEKHLITINNTFKVEAKELSSFEWELRQVVNVIDFKHIINTEKLYSSDDTFKKLVKAKKEATKQCELYINKHN